MIDVQSVRRVVSRFFQVSESEVTDAFVFPIQRIQGSLGRSVFHAAIKRLAGMDLPAAMTARTFGELISGGAAPVLTVPTKPSAFAAADTAAANVSSTAVMPLRPRIGVDLALLGEIPLADSPELAAFHREHFSPEEYAHAQQAADPRLSLLGIWAAKEAVLKCGWAGHLKPRDVGIRWSQSGEPAVSLPAAAEPSGMLALSISHGGDMAVAVCMRLDQ